MGWDSATATRITGMAAYGAATASCAMAAWRTCGTERKWWTCLVALAALLLIDLQINARFMVANALSRVAMRGHWYADRHPVQVGFDLACTAIWLLAGAIILWRARRFGGPLRLAILGGVLAVQLVLLEIVSLHQVDGAMYAELGGVMMVGLGWVAAGGLMVGGSSWRIGKC